MKQLGPTDDELLAIAATAGYAVKPRQLERWHKEHLLPRKVQEHPAGVRGSVGRYPAGTEAQFLALCRWRRQRRKLHELRFWLWWEGYAIHPRFTRATLVRLLPSVQQSRQRSEPDPLDQAEAGAAVVMGQTRSPLARRFRRELRSEADIHSALVALLLPAFGGSPAWGGDELEDVTGDVPPEELLFRGLGLSRAETDTAGGTGPWLPGGAAALPPAIDAVRWAAVADAAGFTGLVEGATDAELAEAREDARLFVEELPGVVAAVEASYGRDAFGFGVVRSLGRGGASEHATCVAACLALRRVVGRAPFAALRATARAMAPQAQVVLALCRAFPQYAAYFGPDGTATLAALSEEERERVAADVQACLAANPGLGDAMEDPNTRSP